MLRNAPSAALVPPLRPGLRMRQRQRRECVFDTACVAQAPSRLLLAADYILSCAANLAAAAAAYCLWWGSSATLAPPAVAAAGAAALLWAVAAQWLRARPTAGMLFGEQHHCTGASGSLQALSRAPPACYMSHVAVLSRSELIVPC